MKLISIITTIIMIGSSSLAKDVCSEIPDALIYKSLVTNFDGSTTVTEPRLTVEGKPLRIAYESHVDQESAQGVCHLLGKTYLTANFVTNWNNSNDPVIFISYHAALRGLPNKSWTDTLYKVVCK